MKAPAGGGPPTVIATLDWEGGPTQVAWSPTSEWIAWAVDKLVLYSPDGKQQKKVGSDVINQAIAFSKEGKTLYSYYLDRREFKWVLEAIDGASGQARLVGVLPIEAGSQVRSLGMHPDGKRFLATLNKGNPDIVLLEGFEQGKMGVHACVWRKRFGSSGITTKPSDLTLRRLEKCPPLSACS